MGTSSRRIKPSLGLGKLPQRRESFPSEASPAKGVEMERATQRTSRPWRVGMKTSRDEDNLAGWKN